MNGRSDVFHDICYGERFSFESYLLTGCGGCSGGVDVHCDGICGGFVVEVEEFCDDELCYCGYEGHSDVYDAVVEKEGRKIWGRSDAHSCSCGRD